MSAVAWHGMVARSTAMREVFAYAEKAARTDANVLIVGETGTGKELIARGIHAVSARPKGPFVVVHCATIPTATMEAELLGHARTVTSPARVGVIEEANQGTLFLDEIGELRRAAQAKIARAVSAKAVRRVGEARERAVDVRYIASTRRDLPSLVTQGAFRDDLYFALESCVIRVPPLRERREDIVALVEHFLRSIRLTDAARTALIEYSWPGNVHELRGALERARMHARGVVIDVDALPPEIVEPVAPHSDRSSDLAALTYREALDRVRTDGVRRYLEALLHRFGGSVTAAAEHADLERESFYRLCRRHGINPANFRPGDGSPKSSR